MIRKLLIKTGLFILPILFVLFLFEYSYRSIPNAYAYKSHYLNDSTKASNIKTLILGTSHAFANINPHCFSEQAFCAAYNSQPIVMDYKITELFLKTTPRLTHLKNVILAYDTYTLSAESKLSNSRKINYRIYWNLDFTPRINQIHCFKCLKPNFTNFKLWLTGKYKIDYDTLGWVVSTHSEKSIDTTQITQLQIKDKADQLSFSSSTQQDLAQSKQYLIKLAKLCQSYNVHLILVGTPLTPLLLQNIPKDDLVYTKNLADSMQKTFNNVKWLDWNSNSDFQLNDFTDIDHLNKYGATKLGYKLDSILKTLPLLE